LRKAVQTVLSKSNFAPTPTRDPKNTHKIYQDVGESSHKRQKSPENSAKKSLKNVAKKWFFREPSLKGRKEGQEKIGADRSTHPPWKKKGN